MTVPWSYDQRMRLQAQPLSWHHIGMGCLTRSDTRMSPLMPMRVSSGRPCGELSTSYRNPELLSQSLQKAAQQPGDLHLADAESFSDLALGQLLEEAHPDQVPFLVRQPLEDRGEDEHGIAVGEHILGYREHVGQRGIPVHAG